MPEVSSFNINFPQTYSAKQKSTAADAVLFKRKELVLVTLNTPRNQLGLVNCGGFGEFAAKYCPPGLERSKYSFESLVTPQSLRDPVS